MQGFVTQQAPGQGLAGAAYLQEGGIDAIGRGAGHDPDDKSFRLRGEPGDHRRFPWKF